MGGRNDEGLRMKGEFRARRVGGGRVICGRNGREARLGLLRREGGGPCLCAEAEEAAGAA